MAISADQMAVLTAAVSDLVLEVTDATTKAHDAVVAIELVDPNNVVGAATKQQVRLGQEKAKAINPDGLSSLISHYATLDTTLPAVIVMDDDGYIVTGVDYDNSNLSSEVFATLDPDLGTLIVDRDGFVLDELVSNGGSSDGNFSDINGQIFATLDPGTTIIIVDLDGFVVAELGGQTVSAEIVTARGTAASLTARLDKSIASSGYRKEPVFAGWRLRKLRMKMRRLQRQQAEQLIIAQIGDSWTHEPNFGLVHTASQLAASLGDAGGGWLGFSHHPSNVALKNGNVRPSIFNYTFTGTWTPTYAGSVSPDICHLTSSVASSAIQVTGTVSAPALSGVSLFYIGTADGVIRYRWNGGAWTTMNVQTSGLQIVSLTGFPTSGAWTLDIEVVSGTCSLCGLDLKSSASGVRVHKLGASGANTASWLVGDATQWQAGLAALNPDVVVIMLAVNDKSSSRTVQALVANYTALIARIRAAVPSADILIKMPPEDNRTGFSVLISQYTAAMLPAADALGCALMDLQYYFGDVPSEYANSNAGRPWMASDLIHPSTSSGAYVIADADLRLYLNN